MTRERFKLGSAHSAAITVRLVAFLVAAMGMATIPATLVATTLGHVTSHGALLTIAGAALLVLLATVAAQRFDPLRD